MPPITQPAFTRLAVVGLLGLLGLSPTLLGLLEGAARGEGPLPSLPGSLSPALLAALSLIQPGLLLLGGVALGVVLAPRVGLRSVLPGLSDRPFSWGDGAAGLLAGVLYGGLTEELLLRWG